MVKYTVVGQAECLCGRKVDVVSTGSEEKISRHFKTQTQGFCGLSLLPVKVNP